MRMDGTPSVLFLCVHNAGRSQMAAAFMRRDGVGLVEVRTGGSTPVAEVNPAVVAAMREVGLDVGAEVPRRFDEDDVREADVVVTMGCGDTCPVFPGKRYEDWELTDPSGLSVDEIRPIRDQIERRVLALLKDLVPSANLPSSA